MINGFWFWGNLKIFSKKRGNSWFNRFGHVTFGEKIQRHFRDGEHACLFIFAVEAVSIFFEESKAQLCKFLTLVLGFSIIENLKYK